MSRTHGLFAQLLGPDFEHLHPTVRRTHGGLTQTLRGVATISRGPHPLARLLTIIAGLPREQRDGPVTVEIAVTDAGERWQRNFGRSRPMVSTMKAVDGELQESLGVLRFQFRLSARDGGIDWQLIGLRAMGIPLPHRLFKLRTRSDAAPAGYHFLVTLAVPLLGSVIHYEGTLQINPS